MHTWLKRLFAQGQQQFGAIKLADHKALSSQRSAITLTPTAGDELVIPLQQHMGDKPELIISVGDYVYKGQMLARADSELSVPLHASTSGTIIAIEERPIPHPSGLHDLCVILQADGLDDASDHYMTALTDYQQQDSNTLRQRIRDAGIVGLGGAVFPAAIKLNVRDHIPVDTLVINGAECEPYITCDEVLMREQAEEILAGAQIMLHILQAENTQQTVRCLTGIEDNKAQAIAVMQQAIATLGDTRIEVVVVPTQYPAGGEKQLIHTLTGKEVPSGGRPADIGIICHNVATARAIYRAVVLGEPLISRYVTVTGDGIEKPGNFEAALGMPVNTFLENGKQHSNTKHKLTMGGPMMGLPLHSTAIPIVKATNCILIQRKQNKEKRDSTPLPCIRCGKCADHCPAGLLPQQLYWYAQAKDFAKAEDYALFDCIECGCCEYVCPSHIPLVDYYRFAKAEIRSQRTAQDKAELARERHDFHNFRLERSRRERAERLAKHKEKAQSTLSGNKKDAIQAALERAKAKKAKLNQNGQADNDSAAHNNSERRARRERRRQTQDTPPSTADKDGAES